ncbi:MAG: hypothetical protein K6T51_12375 [Rubrobacteraceae bacterium]|nr:hypothetical protein [Rubrobacteraceae bacterium]MCL6439398.1 hypothetical protein [Rubrobacteraceae bacterium]
MMRDSDLTGTGSRPARYWLVVNEEGDVMRPLTLDASGKEALPVFSFEEEAEMFLWRAGLEDGWHTRESGAEELRVLLQEGDGIGLVALDPLPEMISTSTVELVCVSAERFVERLRRRGRSPEGRGAS